MVNDHAPASEHTPPGWTGMQRIDGMMVAVSADATWVVLPHGGHTALTLCPCCDKPFSTKRAAMLVANAVYPLGDR